MTDVANEDSNLISQRLTNLKKSPLNSALTEEVQAYK
jgi:hypothetical protein